MTVPFLWPAGETPPVSDTSPPWPESLGVTASGANLTSSSRKTTRVSESCACASSRTATSPQRRSRLCRPVRSCSPRAALVSRTHSSRLCITQRFSSTKACAPGVRAPPGTPGVGARSGSPAWAATRGAKPSPQRTSTGGGAGRGRASGGGAVRGGGGGLRGVRRGRDLLRGHRRAPTLGALAGVGHVPRPAGAVPTAPDRRPLAGGKPRPPPPPFAPRARPTARPVPG